MEKKKKYYGFLSVILLFCVIITPTYGKYVFNHIGLAGFLSFTSLKPTGEFVVIDDDFISENGEVLVEVQSESKWGAGDNPGSNPEEEFGMNALGTVMFTVNNNSSKRLLVSFRVVLATNSWLGWDIEDSTNNVTLINLTKSNQSIEGSFKYVDSDRSNNQYTKLLKPTDKSMFPSADTTTIETLFVLDDDEYAEYQVLISRSNSGIGGIIGGWITTDYYYSFHLVVSEYNPS